MKLPSMDIALPIQKNLESKSLHKLAAMSENQLAGFPDDFPSLLKVEWPQKGGSEKVAIAKNPNGEKDSNHESSEQEVDSDIGNEIVSELNIVEQDPRNNLEEVVAKFLLSNSNLSISVQAIAAISETKQVDRLINEFNSALAKTDIFPAAIAPAKLPQYSRSDLPEQSSSQQSPVAKVSLPSDPVADRAFVNSPNQIKLPIPESSPGEIAIVQPSKNSAIAAGTVVAEQTDLHRSSVADLHRSPVADLQRSPVADLRQPSIVAASAKAEFLRDMQPSNYTFGVSDRSVMKNDGQHGMAIQIFAAELPKNISKIISESLKNAEISKTSSVDSSGNQQPHVLQKLELQLTPRNLGAVHLQIERTKGGISIKLAAETSEAERLLVTEKGSVIDAMRSAGLQVDEFKIGSFSSLGPSAEERQGKGSDNLYEFRNNSFGPGNEDHSDDEYHNTFAEHVQMRSLSAANLDDFLDDQFQKLDGLYF